MFGLLQFPTPGPGPADPVDPVDPADSRVGRDDVRAQALRRSGWDWPEDLEAVAALQAIDPHRLVAASDQMLYLEAARRLSARIAAVLFRAVAAVDRMWEYESADGDDDNPEELHDAGIEEVRAALRISRKTALDRVLDSRALVDRLPSVLSALADGEIDYGHAKVFAELLAEAAEPVLARVVEPALKIARKSTPGRLRCALRTLIADADPAGLAEEVEVLHRTRFLEIDRHGGSLWAQLAPDEMAVVDAALSTLAGRTGPDDDRAIEQRMADALVELCTQAPPAAGPVSPARTCVQLVLDAETLLGWDRPGQVPGIGPIPPETARRLACGATVTALFVDPSSGRLLDLGRTQREPNERMRSYLAARDQHCQFPGCGVPAQRCVIHHGVFWAHGGRTDRTNLVVLCRRHHRAVHEGGWTLIRDNEHSTRWISPAGQKITVTAPSHPRPG